jgi:PAS domain S-box-containing protein
MTSSVAKSLPKAGVNSTEESLICVLYVDDEAGLLKAGKQILEMHGSFQVETALSVNEAMRKIKQKAYDVIVSDYQMPEKNGLDLLKELRENGNKIPFILFTGRGREEVAIEALNLGADHYINKIGDPETVYTQMVHSLHQVVEKNRAKERLRKTKEKFETYVNLARVILIAIDVEGKVTYVNKKGCEVLEYTKEEIVGKDWFSNFLPKRFGKQTKTYAKQLLSGQIKPVEYHENFVLTKNRDERLVGWYNILLRDETGKIIGTLSSGEDITEWKKAERKLRNSEKRLRNTLDNMLEGCQIIDYNWRYLYVNDAVARHGRSKRKNLIGKTMLEMYPGIEGTKMFSLLHRCMKKRVPVHMENEFTYRDGKKGWFELSIQPVPEGIFILSIDITERKKAEEALRESVNRFRELNELLPEVVFEADATGRLTFVNQAAFDRFGYSLEDFEKGLNAFQMLAPEDQGRSKQNIGRVLRGEEIGPNEYMAVRKDGSTFPIIIHSTPIIRGKKPVGIRGVIVDITDLKKAEVALRKSERKYSELINGMNDTAWVIDFDCKFIDVNDASVKVLGYSREELLSMDVFDIDFTLDPEEIRGLVKGMPVDEVQVFETAHTTKEGKTIPVEISSSLVTYQGKQAILSIARDITERKQAEEAVDKMVNDLSMVIEKLGVVGEATRHDVRNKLAVIVNNLYLAKQQLASNHNALEYLDDIESAVGQIEKIFDFSRTYEMIGVEERTYVDVEKSVTEAFRLFSGLGDTKLVNECHGLTVLADSQLRQLFYNLIDDSLKHGEKVSQIKVYYEVGKDHLKLIYEDDGIGVPKAEKEKIFREGYGKGTGYGLYLINKMCEAYGWNIQETGIQGKGIQFTVTIPQTHENGKLTYQFQ